jgi:hypothetical protein
VQSRVALIRDLILIPVPLALLAVGFFVAHVEEGGILMLVCAVAGVWYVLRPLRQKPPPQGGMDPLQPEQSPPPGTGSGGPV